MNTRAPSFSFGDPVTSTKPSIPRRQFQPTSSDNYRKVVGGRGQTPQVQTYDDSAFFPPIIFTALDKSEKKYTRSFVFDQAASIVRDRVFSLSQVRVMFPDAKNLGVPYEDMTLFEASNHIARLVKHKLDTYNKNRWGSVGRY